MSKLFEFQQEANMEEAELRFYITKLHAHILMLGTALAFACETISSGSAYCCDCGKGVCWEPDELIEYIAQNRKEIK